MAKNKSIIASVLKDNPDLKLAKKLGFELKDDGKHYEFTKLGKMELLGEDGKLAQIFDAEPQIANEFLSDFYNKIQEQYVVDLFEQQPLETTFGMFRRTYSKVGDIVEYIATQLQNVIKYDEDTAPTNPFEVKKPEVELKFIKTTDKEFTFVTLNYEQWYGAFINEGGLQNLASVILKNLQDALELNIYDYIRTDLSDATLFSKSTEVTNITGLGDEEGAKKIYEAVMTLRTTLNLPDKTGTNNPASLQNNGTPFDRMVLFINKDLASSLMINVLASLFNSNKIELKWKVIDFDTTKNANILGILMDERAYVYGTRIQFTQSIMNPRNMCINTFSHKWTKRGIVPFYNAIQILKSA